MDKVYQKFLRLGIRLAPVGIETRDENFGYFCTPKGASIIGWVGVDGIHFCRIRGFGNMIFAVSPMNAAPDYVHPIAENFEVLLRLLLACKDAAALEQAWAWGEAQFEAFLEENPATEEQEKTLAEIAEKMKLTAMEQPWAYIRSLQASFDYSKLRYTEDFYDPDMNPAAEPIATEWKAYFDSGFWGHHGKDRAGEELPIGKRFEWAGRPWLIPAAYACAKGLIVDFCMRVVAEEIRAFMKKWDLTQENDSYENFTREQQMEMERDNPLCFDFGAELELNGRRLRAVHGYATCYNPCLPEGTVDEWEAKWAVAHYGLDTAYGWVICRSAFPWVSKRRPKIRTLSLTMEQHPVPIPGPHFTVKAPGDSFRFVHPVSRTAYTLTVKELEQQTLPKNSFGSDRWFYPTHFTAMQYTLSPETMARIAVSDCDEGDKPLEIWSDADAVAPPVSGAAVCVIGGADGPTALVVGTGAQGKRCTACSALHFEPVEGDIEWRVTFHEKQFEDLTVRLL